MIGPDTDAAGPVIGSHDTRTTLVGAGLGGTATVGPGAAPESTDRPPHPAGIVAPAPSPPFHRVPRR